MKIQQMAFMLMALTVFFILVGMFVLMFKFSGLKESATALEEKNALLLVTKLANSPEFSCGNSFGTGKVDCVDGDKLLALKERSGEYFGFWKDIENIIVSSITNESSKECKKDNYPDCNVIDVFGAGTSGFPVENFVTLCKKVNDGVQVYDKCEVAKLAVYYTANE